MSDLQSIIHPAGVQAAHVSHLWWVMFWICAAVWCAVAGTTLAAIVRGRRGNSTASETRLRGTVAAAGGISLLVLVGLLFHSVATGRAMDTLRSPDALRIQVTGNQWWWDVQYVDANPSLRVTTANEIHIPVGRG
jgi:cytochrome c oxidase subunit 2